MIVGVPSEIKNNEYRVAITPAGVEAMAAAGHRVMVQAGAGEASGFTDDYFERAGARIEERAEAIWSRAEMIMKVKEPIPEEWPLLRAGQIVFTYFHFAASKALLDAVAESGAVAIAYETVQLPTGELPLLTPMSEVAGRMSVQQGAKHLERPQGGSGVLLGGVPGVLPGKVLVLGGGVVGTHAALMAAGLGARVAIMDISLQRLRTLSATAPANVNLLFATRYAIRKQLLDSDLVVGAALVAGQKAPVLVERADLSRMRPGSVVVDVAVDQGGCVETTRPTTHEDPVYVVDGVIHYCVTNMPGAVPRSSTLALTNATLPYALQIAEKGWKDAAKDSPDLALGINVASGEVTHDGVAQAFDAPLRPVEEALGRASGPMARFKRLESNPDLPLPAPATPGSAGYDVRSAEDLVIAPGGIRMVRTGLCLELPEGLEAQLRPRSGLAVRRALSIPNSPGTIDPDYRGELCVALRNDGSNDEAISRGDRVAQLVFSSFARPSIVEASELSSTFRGGGFGSTGEA